MTTGFSLCLAYISIRLLERLCFDQCSALGSGSNFDLEQSEWSLVCVNGLP